MLRSDTRADELRETFASWTRAIGSPQDLELLGSLIADDWYYIDLYGIRRNKADYLAFVGEIESYTQDFQDFEVRPLSGTTALVVGKYRARAVATTGERHDNLVAITSLWQRDEAGWRSRFVHTTRVADQPL